LTIDEEQMTPISSAFRGSNQSLPISAKALEGKAKDCCIEYEPIPLVDAHFAQPSKPTFQHIHERPFAVYEFRYRTMDCLVKEGVRIPPSPTTIAKRVRQMPHEERTRMLIELLKEKERLRIVDEELKNAASGGGITAEPKEPRGIKRKRSELDDSSPSRPALRRRLDGRAIGAIRMMLVNSGSRSRRM